MRFLSLLSAAVLATAASAAPPSSRLQKRDAFTYRILLTTCLPSYAGPPPTDASTNGTLAYAQPTETQLALLFKSPTDVTPLGVSSFNSTPPFRPNIPNTIEWRVAPGPDTDGRYDLEYSPTILGGNVTNLYDEEFPGEGVDGILIGGVNGAVWRLRVGCVAEEREEETVEFEGVGYACNGAVVCSGIF
ncbi:hypothetical protein BJ508DRAFT_132586 [Ascobolus immersus RN42]|uniref:Ubiquitin 3 binding protein But2 C-terminal domain-containing protein n=1 Tax=Ascobolus immersus RN42 TaxID=1160509 RepID=A0A3N4I743_ASCIM|nr:hypothetical protein BJ508DRAFT_132586 [Ascobolus immersus RN42]